MENLNVENSVNKASYLKFFEKWYIDNRLPADLRDEIFSSYEAFCKEQKVLMIFNLIVPILCVAVTYIFIRKQFDFDILLFICLFVWLVIFLGLVLLTIGFQNFIRRKKAYPIYSRWIKNNVIWLVISLPDNEEREQELLQILRDNLRK